MEHCDIHLFLDSFMIFHFGCFSICERKAVNCRTISNICTITLAYFTCQMQIAVADSKRGVAYTLPLVCFFANVFHSFHRFIGKVLWLLFVWQAQLLIEFCHTAHSAAACASRRIIKKSSNGKRQVASGEWQVASGKLTKASQLFTARGSHSWQLKSN